MLIALLVLGLGVTAYAARAHLRADEEPVVRMAKLLVATCFSALLSVVFLGLLVLATALPVYAKLMQR
jgi:O-antigen/teichoic acid export membrane protein